jgi:hypothetical protein
MIGSTYHVHEPQHTDSNTPSFNSFWVSLICFFLIELFPELTQQRNAHIVLHTHCTIMYICTRGAPLQVTWRLESELALPMGTHITRISVRCSLFTLEPFSPRFKLNRINIMSPACFARCHPSRVRLTVWDSGQLSDSLSSVSVSDPILKFVHHSQLPSSVSQLEPYASEFVIIIPELYDKFSFPFP